MSGGMTERCGEPFPTTLMRPTPDAPCQLPRGHGGYHEHDGPEVFVRWLVTDQGTVVDGMRTKP